LHQPDALVARADLSGYSATSSVHLKSSDVFVTAEQDSRATGPSGPEVLKATIQP